MENIHMHRPGIEPHSTHFMNTRLIVLVHVQTIGADTLNLAGRVDNKKRAVKTCTSGESNRFHHQI
jgi:hypothetical protein